MNEKEKPILHLLGPGGRVFTVEELVAAFKALTGRDPSPEDVARLKAEMRDDGSWVSSGLSSSETVDQR